LTGDDLDLHRRGNQAEEFDVYKTVFRVTATGVVTTAHSAVIEFEAAPRNAVTTSTRLVEVFGDAFVTTVQGEWAVAREISGLVRTTALSSTIHTVVVFETGRSTRAVTAVIVDGRAVTRSSTIFEEAGSEAGETANTLTTVIKESSAIAVSFTILSGIGSFASDTCRTNTTVVDDGRTGARTSAILPIVVSSVGASTYTFVTVVEGGIAAALSSAISENDSAIDLIASNWGNRRVYIGYFCNSTFAGKRQRHGGYDGAR